MQVAQISFRWRPIRFFFLSRKEFYIHANFVYSQSVTWGEILFVVCKEVRISFSVGWPVYPNISSQTCLMDFWELNSHLRHLVQRKKIGVETCFPVPFTLIIGLAMHVVCIDRWLQSQVWLYIRKQTVETEGKKLCGRLTCLFSSRAWSTRHRYHHATVIMFKSTTRTVRSPANTAKVSYY